MSALGIWASLLRGVHVAALASLFGTLVFGVAVIGDAAMSQHLRRSLLRLARISAALALLAGVAWLGCETALVASTASLRTTVQALPVVALQTQYGRWMVLRCALVIAAVPMLQLRRMGAAIATVLAGAAIAVQPLLGHAGAVGGGTGAELIASEALHLLAAGAWLGGLLPLLLAVSVLPHEAAASACRAFTPIGLAAVLLLGGTAVVQVAALMGGMPGLFGTGYGHAALVKLGLFVVLLALAALNRLVLTERIAAAAGARRHMQLSIAVEIALGALVILTAGFLASRTPGAHEEPVWPFPWRPSASAFSEPLLRGELVTALIATVVGVAVVLSGVWWRRVRWFAFAIGGALVAVAIPHLDLLFVEAYPTSFYASPTEFAATAIVNGARLFATNCVACHGAQGRGDGPAAKALPVPPADLTASHFWAHTDGELYWYIAHGFTAPDGAAAMPGFSGALSSEAIWDLIDYLRANNAGDTVYRTGTWSPPMPMPQFDARCANGRSVDLDDLRGRPIRIIAVAGDDPAEAFLADPDVTTILVTRKPVPLLPAATCIGSEPQLWGALAIIAGVSPEALGGMQLLVDQNAWLRAKWHPGEAPDWNDPLVLSSVLRDIASHPLIASSSVHAHRH